MTHERRPRAPIADSLPTESEAEKNGRPRIKVEDLMANHREVVLVHAGAEYVLRVTSNGRLILTK